MERIWDRVAGLDVHRDWVVGCVRMVVKKERTVAKHKFATKSEGLAELASWSWRRPACTWKPVVYATPGEIVRCCQVRGDQAGSNAVLAAVLRQARGDAVAVRTVLMAVLPGLAALSARRHHLVGGELVAWTDIDQLDQDIVATALDKITAMAGEDCHWVASIVVGAVRDVLRHAERRHRRDRAMTLPLSAAAGRIAAPDLDTVEANASVLVDAARSGLLARDRAALLYAIRVLGHTPRELAVASGRDVRAVRVQRARAERTLARRLAPVS